MIRSENARVSFLDSNGQTVQMSDLYGLSTDTKPTTGLANGSIFVEVDTGKLFLFNEDTGEWSEISTGGGGAENYKETLTGTLASPWGLTDYEMAFAEYLEGVQSGDISLFVEFDASALGGTHGFNGIVSISGRNVLFCNGASITSSSQLAYDARWDVSGLAYAYMLINGVVTDIVEYASSIPTTLTVFHHPMPTN